MTLRVVQGQFDDPFDPSTKIGRDANRLLAYVKQHADGFTRDDAADHFQWRLPYFRRVLREVRLFQAKHKVNLVCAPDPQHHQGPWIYQLTGEWEEAVVWADNRLGDAETRFVTIRSIAQTEMNAYARNTVRWRKARLIFKGMDRLIEDLAELLEEAM